MSQQNGTDNVLESQMSIQQSCLNSINEPTSISPGAKIALKVCTYIFFTFHQYHDIIIRHDSG